MDACRIELEQYRTEMPLGFSRVMAMTPRISGHAGLKTQREHTLFSAVRPTP